MSSNKDKLLDGYNLQSTTQEVKSPPLAEGESYTISDKPDRFVLSIFEALSRFEANNSKICGKAYIFACMIILTVLFVTKQTFLRELPGLEVIFVAFLVTFILNYYLLNGALYKPFLDDEDHSLRVKLTGGYAVGAIACFFYSLEFIEIQTALPIFYCSFFLVILVQAFFFKQSFQQNELLLALGALAGTIITISSSSGIFWSEGTPSNPSAAYGYGLSVISAILMAIIMINFEKMSNENHTTLNHIFSMIVVLFLPIFFPIQGVVTPTLVQWVILVVAGILTGFATLFFIRSFQLEVGGRASVFMFLQVALFLIVEFVAAQASGFFAIIGALITIGCVAQYSRMSESKSARTDQGDIMAHEMNVYRSYE